MNLANRLQTKAVHIIIVTNYFHQNLHLSTFTKHCCHQTFPLYHMYGHPQDFHPQKFGKKYALQSLGGRIHMEGYVCHMQGIMEIFNLSNCSHYGGGGLESGCHLIEANCLFSMALIVDCGVHWGSVGDSFNASNIEFLTEHHLK